MGRSIMVTSFKGGVGKSTVAVNLAVGLAAGRHKVLIVDLDASSGSVDLFMGCEHDTLYNFCDVASGNVGLKDAVHEKKSERKNPSGEMELCYSLDILKAPPSFEMGIPPEQAVAKFSGEAKAIYDFVIFDCPSGKFALFEALARDSEYIFVVTLHSAASIRSAEKLALCLSECGIKSENVRLVINCFNSKGVARGVNFGIVEIIERSKIRLVGLVATNNFLRDYQEVGKTAYDTRGKRIKAPFDDMIGRILEHNVVLNKKYDGLRTDSLYFKKETKKNME